MLEGTERVALPRPEVWRRLNDPAVLRACTPGMERLEECAPDRFEAELSLQIPAIAGRFAGGVEILERMGEEALRLRLHGKGAPGFVDGVAHLTLHDTGETATEVRYRATVQVGGTVARLGQRLVSSASRELAGQFFEELARYRVGADAPEGGQVAPRATRHPLRAAVALLYRTLLNWLGLSQRS